MFRRDQSDYVRGADLNVGDDFCLQDEAAVCNGQGARVAHVVGKELSASGVQLLRLVFYVRPEETKFGRESFHLHSDLFLPLGKQKSAGNGNDPRESHSPSELWPTSTVSGWRVLVGRVCDHGLQEWTSRKTVRRTQCTHSKGLVCRFWYSRRADAYSDISDDAGCKAPLCGVEQSPTAAHHLCHDCRRCGSSQRVLNQCEVRSPNGDQCMHWVCFECLIWRRKGKSKAVRCRCCETSLKCVRCQLDKCLGAHSDDIDSYSRQSRRTIQQMLSRQAQALTQMSIVGSVVQFQLVAASQTGSTSSIVCKCEGIVRAFSVCRRLHLVEWLGCV